MPPPPPPRDPPEVEKTPSASPHLRHRVLYVIVWIMRTRVLVYLNAHAVSDHTMFQGPGQTISARSYHVLERDHHRNFDFNYEDDEMC